MLAGFFSPRAIARASFAAAINRFPDLLMAYFTN
jgi:hypothetical protein